MASIWYSSDDTSSMATVLEALLHQSANLCQSICIVFSFKLPVDSTTRIPLRYLNNTRCGIAILQFTEHSYCNKYYYY